MRPDRLLKDRLREVFVVTLDNGEAFSGLLYAVDARSVVLRQVELIEGTTRQPVDGELVLPRARVLYLQKP